MDEPTKEADTKPEPAQKEKDTPPAEKREEHVKKDEEAVKKAKKDAAKKKVEDDAPKKKADDEAKAKKEAEYKPHDELSNPLTTPLFNLVQAGLKEIKDRPNLCKVGLVIPIKSLY